MSDVAALIADMVRAGVDPDIIGRTAAALSEREPVMVVDEQAERRRAKDRDRKRLRNSAESVESAENLSPKKETSPTPPKEKTTPIQETETREFHEVFWPAYPLKRGKPDALKAFRSARKRAGLDAIMAGVRRYAAERHGEDPKYTKHAQGWLNADGWTDEPTPVHQAQPRAQPPPKKVNMWIAEGRKQGILDDPASTGRLEAGFGGGLSQGSNLARRITHTGSG